MNEQIDVYLHKISLTEGFTVKKIFSSNNLVLPVLALCLVALCASCSSGGTGVPNDIIQSELGIVATRADDLKIQHDANRSSHIDTVTVSVTYDNDYCKQVCTKTSQYQYRKSDDLWDCISEGNWSYDEHLKDFVAEEGRTRFERFTAIDGTESNANTDPEIYFCLDISEGSIDTENNTFECRYGVEKTKNYERVFAFESDGFTTVKAGILGGGAVYIDLEDPHSNQSQRVWLNGDALIEPYYFS